MHKKYKQHTFFYFYFQLISHVLFLFYKYCIYNQQEINTMIRDINILNTGIFPKLEHVFSSKKHKIFRAYQRKTAQTYLTKIIIANDERIFNLYKQHIANVILPYLVSIKYLNQSSLLSLQQECGLAMVKTQYEKENDQSYDYEGNELENNQQTLVRKEKDSQTIMISKKMIKGVTLREMILNKDERLNEQFCLDLIAQIVDFLLLGNGVRDIFITTQNIIVEDSGAIHFNYFSFVGLEFIKQDKYITKVQFEQILPYLTPTLMKNKNTIDIQVELRFILINYVAAYFKKDIIFGAGHFDLEVQVKRDKQLLTVVTKVTDSLLPDILSPASKKKLENQKRGMINLWNELFKQKKKVQKQGQYKQAQNNQIEVKRTFNCTWQYIIQNLSTYHQKYEVSEFGSSEQKDNQQIKNESKQQMIRKCKMKIKHFISKLNTNQKKNCVHIATSLHSLIDIFIDILDNLMQTNSSRLKLKNVAKIQKLRDDLVFERSDLMKRGRYSKSLYIPIKTGMRFASILKYKNWVMMLQMSDSANQATIQAIFNLLKFILDIRETMVEIGNQISTNLLQSILSNKEFKNVEGNSLVDQINQFYSLMHSLNEYQNFRRYFWQIFFVITNKIVILAKEFYLRATSFSLDLKIKINQQDFSSILQNFKQFIPPPPQQPQQKVSWLNSSPKKSSHPVSDAGVN